MPTYHSPLQSQVTCSSPSARLPSRSKSFSNSSSTTSNRGRTISSLGSGRDGKAETKKEIPYFFLSSIAAATLIAHKYWPEGFPHSDKEDWELSDLAWRAKQRRLAEKAASRASVRDRRGSMSGFGGQYGLDDRIEPRGGGYWEERRRLGSGTYRTREEQEYGYRRDDRGWDWERGGKERRGSVASGIHGRDRVFALEQRYQTPSQRGIYTDRLVGEAERHYSSTPERHLLEQSMPMTSSSGFGKRYLIERSSSNAGLATGSRISGSSGRDYCDYDRGPSGATYIYRDAPDTSRRVPFDAGRTGRHNDTYDWYHR